MPEVLPKRSNSGKQRTSQSKIGADWEAIARNVRPRVTAQFVPNQHATEEVQAFVMQPTRTRTCPQWEHRAPKPTHVNAVRNGGRPCGQPASSQDHVIIGEDNHRCACLVHSSVARGAQPHPRFINDTEWQLAGERARNTIRRIFAAVVDDQQLPGMPRAGRLCGQPE